MTVPPCALDPEMWFVDPSGMYGPAEQCAEAMRLCRSCPALAECREEADRHEGTTRDLRHLFGVWAGEMPLQRLERRGIEPVGLPRGRRGRRMTSEALVREPLHPGLAVGMPAARALAAIEVRGIHDGDLTALRELSNLRDLAAAGLVAVARALNKQGHSWAEIGQELGITRQGAFQAFAERKPSVDESERYEGLF